MQVIGVVQELLEEGIKGMPDEKLQELLSPDNKLIPESRKEELRANPEAAKAYFLEQAKNNVSKLFKYTPKTLTDYNMIRAATGRKPLPQEEWNKYQAALKRERQIGSGGAMAKHSKK